MVILAALLYSLDGIVAFSNAPLYMASIAGVFSFIVAIIAMLFIIIRRLVFGDPVAGWASTVVIILFIGGIQLLSIGILGLYLSKLYLEAKDRPIYLIGESNIEKSTEKIKAFLRILNSIAHDIFFSDVICYNFFGNVY